MKFGRFDPWPYQRVPCDPLVFLATKGQSLFTKRNPKTDVKGVTMGLNVMEPGSNGPWPQKKVSCDPFGFLVTKGPSLLCKQNPKTAI